MASPAAPQVMASPGARPIPTPITPKTPASMIHLAASSVKIYNAVYSSVQVYECMIRGIAVMRRRSDSYVNATQILKVAGIDKGRRTKILEKEILPGKHEIVQGGYGKYQGTWIPLDRGRELSTQYGVAPLLAPLFDFIPTAQASQLLPGGLPGARGVTPNRQIGGSPFPFQYNPVLHSTPLPPPPPPPGRHAGSHSPTPILPGSALKLLHQGRAQGLFTPSSTNAAPPHMPGGGYPLRPSNSMPSSPAPNALKRVRSEYVPQNPIANGSSDPDILMAPPSIDPNKTPTPAGQPPAKRARRDSELQPSPMPSPGTTNFPRAGANGKQVNGTRFDPVPRFATKSSVYRTVDRASFLRNPKRAAVVAAIQGPADNAQVVVESLTSISAVQSEDHPPDLDVVLDDQGHTALHLAASLARVHICQALVEQDADVRRGSFTGETALIRTVLSTHAFDSQSFNTIVALLHPSIRTLDNSRRTVLHHIAHVAGVKGRAPAARYYLECVLMWIAQREEGDFKSVLDVQDEHGDTALNIAARVGNRSLVKTFVDVGANRILPNKLGLRPGDFGVEEEDLLAPGPSDVLATLRGSSGVPAQKSQDVISDMTAIINSLSDDFAVEVKDKQIALEQAQQRLKTTTRELADQRRQIQTWQSRCNELEEVQQRIRNLQRAILEEDESDWTGRSEWDKKPATAESAGLAFVHRGLSSTLAGQDESNLEAPGFGSDPDPPIPASDSVASLVQLRRMEMWHRRMDTLLNDRLTAIKGASAERELQCKKIIAMSTGLPLEQIENMTGALLIALESEPSMGDLNRIANFMQKVKEGEKEPVAVPWNLSR